MTDPLLARALAAVADWEATWGDFEPHPSLHVVQDRLDAALAEYVDRLGGNYPFHHPRYAGQMLKPPHPVARAAYAAAQRINPNNHALDGGPPTSEMEKEVVAELAAMVGFPAEALGHLTGGGTMANLEALFVARETHPGRAVAFSEAAHYTHARMAHVLGMETVSVPADASGRMEVEALEAALRDGRIGTVIVTPGTTGLGAVDPVDEIVPLARRYGARVHADAAYGGFFALLAGTDAAPDGFPHAAFAALAECDSLVIDPHKHGLQPYGCGAVLFRDPAVGRFYRHDSPYTYFTSAALHLGEISLECSRPGAAAGALWLTLRALPLRADDGLGPILAGCLRAAKTFSEAVGRSDRLVVVQPPTLDIVAYAPKHATASGVDAAAQALFERAMNDPDDPVFVSVFRVEAALLADRLGVEADRPTARVLRSVLMKPEHETHAEALVARLDALAAQA